MKITRWRTTTAAPTRFEGIKELVVHPAGSPSSHREALECADIQCQRGRPWRRASDCLHCAHFANFRPGPGGAVTMRCLWCDDDPVEQLMTPASAVVTIGREAVVAAAVEVAASADSRHLVVVDREAIAGVICRCDLLPAGQAGETVGDRMNAPPWGIDHTASLGAAVTLMREERIGILLVVRRERLAGVLTRGDLRRAGAPEELLGAEYCVACGSAHGVAEHPRLRALSMCIECSERLLEPVDEDELGGGD